MADIVVNISRQEALVSQVGFGVALIVANTQHTYTEYTSLTSLESDFATTTTVYKMAQGLLAQDVSPSRFAVAGIAYTETNNVGAETLTNTSGNIYSFANQEINVDSITGLSDGGGAIDDADIQTIDYAAGTIEFTGARTGSVTVTGYTYNSDAAGFTTLLNQLVTDNRDFYLVLQEAENYTAQKVVSDWAATQIKIHFIRTQVLASAYPVSLGNRTAVYYHLGTDEFADALVAGVGLPKDPGSLTWANQVVTGATANTLTGTVISDLTTGRFNTIISMFGRTITNNGFLQGTLFIDQTRTQDYVKITLETNIAELIIINDKIAYDDTGIAQVVNAVDKTLNEATDDGIILRNAIGQGEFSITSVPRANISDDDITSRTITTVEFEYVEAGAIENATITGRIVRALQEV